MSVKGANTDIANNQKAIMLNERLPLPLYKYNKQKAKVVLFFQK